MMVELAPPWGKFRHPWWQVQQKNCPGLLLYSQTSVVGIAKGQENVTAINLTYELSELFLRNTNSPKNEPESVVLNWPSFRRAFWTDLFFELLLGLPYPLMQIKCPTFTKRTNQFIG